MIKDYAISKQEGVPYYSQSLDVLDKEGNIDKYWFRRACGIACAKMILDYFRPEESKSLLDLANEGRDKGGYSQAGWRHDYFLELFKEYGLTAFRKEQMDYQKGVKEMAYFIKDGGLVIASCVVPFMTETDFHMILLKGVRWKDAREDSPVGFYYSDPDSINKDSAAERYVGTEMFGNYWRKMAIFVTDPKTAEE